MITYDGQDYIFNNDNGLLQLYDTDGNLLAQCELFLEYYHAIFYDQEGQHLDIFDCQQHENYFNNDTEIAHWLIACHPDF